jgi:ethanolamine utilization protein EutQ (cupin superfamily)
VPDFPKFVRSPANRIAASSQFADVVEGYVFDGADGSQVALWTAHADRVSREHVHDFDEHVLVIEGRCTIILGSKRIEPRAGQGFVISKGTSQSMPVVECSANASWRAARSSRADNYGARPFRAMTRLLA